MKNQIEVVKLLRRITQLMGGAAPEHNRLDVVDFPNNESSIIEFSCKERLISCSPQRIVDTMVKLLVTDIAASDSSAKGNLKLERFATQLESCCYYRRKQGRLCRRRLL